MLETIIHLQIQLRNDMKLRSSHKLLLEIFQRIAAANTRRLMLILLDKAITQLQLLQHLLRGKQLFEVESHMGFHAKSFNLAEIHRPPEQRTRRIGLATVNPIDEMGVAIVEQMGTRRHPIRLVFRAQFPRRQLLGAQIWVGLMSANWIEQLGDWRHSERRIKARIELPSLAKTIREVDIGIETQPHIGMAIFHTHETERGRKAVDGEIVLGKKLHIGAETTHLIGGSRHTMNAFRSRKRRAQVGAHQHFALPFYPKSRATQRGIEIGIDAGT